MIPLLNFDWGTTALLGALLAFSWAAAGGLFAALSLQRHRNEAGASQLQAKWLAFAAFPLALLSPITGFIVPLWVLWASRGFIAPNAQRAG
jgi:hypothetical protein